MTEFQNADYDRISKACEKWSHALVVKYDTLNGYKNTQAFVVLLLRSATRKSAIASYYERIKIVGLNLEWECLEGARHKFSNSHTYIYLCES